jgi:hypothetical protein
MLREGYGGGQSQFDNLAWACLSYKLHKANRVATLDPDTGNQMLLKKAACLLHDLFLSCSSEG